MTKKSDKKHVAVLGAGIIGINCAISLLQRGYKVTLIDKGNIGEGCSKNNAGHFATEQVFPLAKPSLLWQLPKMLCNPLGPVSFSPKHFLTALPWFFQFINNMLPFRRRKNTQALVNINKQAIDCYKHLLKEAQLEHLLIEKGSLLVFEKTSLKLIHKHLNMYLAQGINVKLLDREQSLLLEPNLHQNIQHSLYFIDVGHTIDPLLLSQNLFSYAENLGCKYLTVDVEKIIHENNSVLISNQDTLLTFDHLVIATGAHSKKLLEPLAYKLPIEAERGYSLDLDQRTLNMLSRPVASAERQFIITPMSHGLRFSGTVEFAGLQEKPNMTRATSLHENAKFIIDKLPNVNIEESSKWMGFRPSLPDSLPVIGNAPNHTHITFALGHQHLGLTLGAITGKLVGQLINNEKTDIDISPFCISRFNT